MDERFDYVVVGGGSGGSPVAGRLAEAGARVLVLEAGGTDRRADVLIPAGLPLVYRSANWKYIPEPDPTRHGSTEAWPAGRILGGGGSINAMVFVRGNRADFDGWARQGAKGWDYESVLPDFRRLESWCAGDDEYRGGSGPIRVGFQSYRHVTIEPFIAAAMVAGHPFTADYNGQQQIGVSHLQVNHRRRGIRSQASREYLRKLAVRTPVTVRTNSFVYGLLFSAKRAIGVEYVRSGRRLRAYADQEVILAAGSLATPKLLMLSGIGPARHLADKNVGLRVDLPGVGENLQEHPAVMQRWDTPVDTVNSLGAFGAVQAAYRYCAYGQGMLTSSVYQAQVFHKSSPSLIAPDLQIGFCCFAVDRIVGPDGKVKVQPSRRPGLQVTVNMLHPRYRGRLELRSADPQAPPVIRHRLLGTEEDTRDLLAGMAEARRIMDQEPMRDFVGGQFEPERDCRTTQDWSDLLRRSATNGAHPVGTCAMGTDDYAVVDPQLRVRGVDRLRISDASVMPSLTSGNTNAASMMIGERAAREILGSAVGHAQR
ncbi:GMC family oxidoreductase [Mycolicibacterium fortuitum]|nr:GMC family oxidoreductase N-terminal domain-containing protein [Mycolicibacterium fortuitum]